MKSLVVVALLMFACVSVNAQVTFLGSVGTPQSVPEPIFSGGSAGNIVLGGLWQPTGCSNPGLNMTVSGLPIGYNGLTTFERVVFYMEAGQSSLPGFNRFGGQFYMPFQNQTAMNGGSSVWLGPGDTVPCLGQITMFGPVAPLTNNGASINYGALPSIGVGNFTVQALLFDRAAGRYFTSNAINFSIP